MAENRSALRSPSAPESNFSEEIERRAYEIYIQRGQGDGYALDDWLRAESELGSASHHQQPLYSPPRRTV